MHRLNSLAFYICQKQEIVLIALGILSVSIDPLIDKHYSRLFRMPCKCMQNRFSDFYGAKRKLRAKIIISIYIGFPLNIFMYFT